ncbi:MAG TPA: hypothetical protein DCE41_04625 [Cytophagales bacterium]|nr:hypothetical protein [Cytophagales bacterium]HAA23087.1 hypothetical protein [Cytophagales bacterium]HAP64284.1 hypothetical protein [Cytophagales bacterium]
MATHQVKLHRISDQRLTRFQNVMYRWRLWTQKLKMLWYIYQKSHLIVIEVSSDDMKSLLEEDQLHPTICLWNVRTVVANQILIRAAEKIKYLIRPLGLNFK